jgi:outer membrane protein OmpA-like peptidoglycan-associated protein
MHNISKISLALAITLSASVYSQAQTQEHARADDPIPAFRVTVVSRTAQAVNYRHHSGATKVDFQGTDLMPGARGEAKVNTRRGALGIDAEFSGLDRPTAFGNEYLTYVMWAISPEGRSVNLGEVLVGDNHRSKLDVTTDLQAFALIVTAEPYYAVRRPSNVVVMENVIREDTRGRSETVDAKYELTDRGGYIPTGYKFDPVVLGANLPLEFYEARNAVRIAQSAGAERYASTSYGNAIRQMNEADAIATTRHEDKKALISISRETVQTAEDSREIAMKRIDSDRAEYERNASAGREADANSKADRESQRRVNAEGLTAGALRDRDEADRKNRDAQAAAQQAQGAQAAAEADSDRNRAQRDEADRKNKDAQAAAQQAQGAQATAEADSNRNRAERDEADRRNRDAQAATQQAQGAQAAAEADSDRNRAAAASSDRQLQQAVQDREALRARLLQQFSLILETRDTARGLVVNMSDVLFDSGQYTLRPMAREKLAKISGIVLAYPTLKLAVEGNTDSVGTEQFNQTLSENRAGAVRNYLTKQGVPESSTTAAGFGKTRPIASNDTADGRQQNRRVELIVSGEVIGTKIVSIEVLPVSASSTPRK